MRRRTRWIIGLLIAAALIGGGIAVGLTLVLPAIVRHEVATVFARLGFEQASFELRRTSLWHADVVAIASGPAADQRLQIGDVSIDYSPLAALSGQIDTVRIRNGTLAVSVDQLSQLSNASSAPATSSSEASNQPLPVRSLALESCELIVEGPHHAASIKLPVNATLLRAPSGWSQLNLRAMLGDTPLTVSGTIDRSTGKIDLMLETSSANVAPIVDVLPAKWQAPIDSAGGNLSLRAEYHSDNSSSNASVRFWLRDAFAVGRGSYQGDELRGMNVSCQFNSLRPLTTPPTTQRATIKSIKAAGQEFTDANLQFQASRPDLLRIAALSSGWAGGKVWADPFQLKPPWTKGSIVLTIDQIDMKDVLELLTQGRAGGTGKLSGHIPLSIDWPHVQFGEGFIASTGGGMIQLGAQSSEFGDLLGKADPRFNKDPKMQQVKDQVTAAMVDFEYTQIRADFHREQDHLLISLHIQGHGRTGQKQPLDITLNFRGLEDTLNSYLASR